MIDVRTVDAAGKCIAKQGLDEKKVTLKDCQEALAILSKSLLKDGHRYVRLEKSAHPKEGYELELVTFYNDHNKGNFLRGLYDRMPENESVSLKGDVLYGLQLWSLAVAINKVAISTDNLRESKAAQADQPKPPSLLAEISGIQGGRQPD